MKKTHYQHIRRHIASLVYTQRITEVSRDNMASWWHIKFSDMAIIYYSPFYKIAQIYGVKDGNSLLTQCNGLKATLSGECHDCVFKPLESAVTRHLASGNYKQYMLDSWKHDMS